jgi:hypothetical protein
MRRIGSILLALAFLAFGLSLGCPAHAVSQKLRLETRLTDELGSSFPGGNYTGTFKIFKTNAGGTAIWSETKSVSVSKSGYLATVLGTETAFSTSVLMPDLPTTATCANVFASESRWIEITLASATETTVFPRKKISTAAYAANADTLDGRDSSQFAAVSHSHSASQITPGEITSNSTDEVLYVYNAGTGSAISGESKSGVGVQGITSATGKAAVAGSSTGGNGIGVWGYSYDEYGVIGETYSGIAGVMGRHNKTGNWVDIARGDMALKAFASATGGHGIEVSSSMGDGLRSFTSAASKSGLYSVASGSGGYGAFLVSQASNGVGLYAEGGTAGWAATFKGNVRILDRTSGAVIMELGKGLDYAEGFDVTSRAPIAQGSVLAIDPEHPGKLSLSSAAYDTKVAGIVAGANSLGSGVRLGAGQFDLDVALAGRVYCNVDATETEIKPGDLLTTSAIPGYAMKASDYGRAQGAILGKAMERMKRGDKGQILVLVTLQ